MGKDNEELARKSNENITTEGILNKPAKSLH